MLLRLYLKLPFSSTLFEVCLVLKVIIFSKLISLIYFNVFIEVELMLVSSLIYWGFVLEIKVLLFYVLSFFFCLCNFLFAVIHACITGTPCSNTVGSFVN